VKVGIFGEWQVARDNGTVGFRGPDLDGKKRVFWRFWTGEKGVNDGIVRGKIWRMRFSRGDFRIQAGVFDLAAMWAVTNCVCVLPGIP